jgi:hypothetical protein
VELLVHDNRADTRNRAVAALSQAAAVLINPTYDGFNLAAKEALLLSDRATILLSRNAGAFEQLAPAVLPLSTEAFQSTTTIFRPHERACMVTARPAGSRRSDRRSSTVSAMPPFRPGTGINGFTVQTPVFADLRAQLDRALRSDRRSTRRIAIDAVKAVMRRFYCSG